VALRELGRFENQPRVLARLAVSAHPTVPHVLDAYELDSYQAGETLRLYWRTAVPENGLIMAEGRLLRPSSPGLTDRLRYLPHAADYIHQLCPTQHVCAFTITDLHVNRSTKAPPARHVTCRAFVSTPTKEDSTVDNLSPSVQATLDALTGLGEGDAHEIAQQSGKSRSTTDKALRQLADGKLIVEVGLGTDAAEGTPPRWRPAAEAVAGDLSTSPDPGDEGGNDGTAETAAAASDPTARPRPADRKVLIVAGVLGDYPDGATIEVVADACGLGVATVARLLTAMAEVDAARRIPADPDAGTPELWQPGEGKASAVDPNPAPQRCTTCGQVIRSGRTTPVTGSAAVNNDGSQPLGRNILRGWVLEFIGAHPGHQFTPQVIATELSAQHSRDISAGAVRNNCTTLAAAGQIQLATKSPLAFTANRVQADDSGQ
jgi:hypothetical protein